MLNGDGNAMSKTIIIYASKTGFSRRYAQWLAEDLGERAVSFRDRNTLRLQDFDTIILFGGLYAGQMSGLKWLQKQPLAGKRLAAVAVGCAPVDNPGLPESMEQLFGGAPEIKGFYCQGGLDYEHMGGVDRIMMAALRRFLKNKPDQKDMLEGISHSFDAADRAYLAPVAAWARER